jgi:hypothetical protein
MTTIVTEIADDAKPRVWRQAIGVRGNALQLLESVSNVSRRNPEANTLILQGEGAWFPQMSGPSWAAICGERKPDATPLSDLTPILRLLLDEAPLATSDAPRGDVEAWLRGGSL